MILEILISCGFRTRLKLDTNQRTCYICPIIRQMASLEILLRSGKPLEDEASGKSCIRDGAVHGLSSDLYRCPRQKALLRRLTCPPGPPVISRLRIPLLTGDEPRDRISRGVTASRLRVGEPDPGPAAKRHTPPLPGGLRPELSAPDRLKDMPYHWPGGNHGQRPLFR
jgi:hypothetical protein